ncbi:MAG: class I SAM-dependent methyltransferase [Verrucomicrobia bacterium]|nr:class I SAM-dependent methyltransferase [Verrucomicrobiota bacterium]
MKSHTFREISCVSWFQLLFSGLILRCDADIGFRVEWGRRFSHLWVMMEFPPRPTRLAQQMLGELLGEGDVAIDATAGNGHDTQFLAGCVGATGRVLAFDVQEAAMRSTRERLREVGLEERVEFHLASHARMAEFAGAGSVAAVMFNLGYLPGEDHALATEAAETMRALDAAAVVLKSGAVLSVVCYPGHPQGAEEAASVEQWMNGRAADAWRVAKYSMVGTKSPAPFLMIARKP